VIFDPYDWSKNRLDYFIKKIEPIKNDGLKLSDGDIWSIKKYFVIDYLIDGFVTIYRKHFPNCFYVDTHCGAGLIGFREKELSNVNFPGSALIAAFRNTTHPFTDCFFLDNDPEVISALTKRLKKLGEAVGSHNYRPLVQDFEQSVNFIMPKVKYGNIFFFVIDSTGFKEIKWSLMKQLLSIEKADFIFTFMTHVVSRHRSNAKDGNEYSKTLDGFYGNNDWLPYTEGEDLMKLYKNQMRQFKKYVVDMPVFQEGKQLTYHILVATDNDGAKNIIESAKKITKVQTEMIDGGLKVVSNIHDDLTKWMGMNEN